MKTLQYRLRSVTVGGYTMTNVQASIGERQRDSARAELPWTPRLLVDR
jgi:hypothetical protein